MSIFLRDGGRRGEAGWIWECSAFLRVGWWKKGVEESAAHWLYSYLDLFSPFCFWYIFDLNITFITFFFKTEDF